MRRITRHQYNLRKKSGKGVIRTKNGYYAVPKKFTWLKDEEREEKKNEQMQGNKTN